LTKSNKDPSSYITKVVPNSIYISYIELSEVKNELLNLKNSSPGWDDVTAMVVKASYEPILQSLTNVLSLSFSQGVFPSELKTAKVIPIFKNDNPMYFTNYRPISVLSTFSKLFERLMYNRMLSFIEKNNLLYKFQFGFRRLHSTNMALIVLLDKIMNAIDNKDSVIGIFLDFSKAFDTVNHEILLKKLYKYGFRVYVRIG
jgi:hypothetical protein